MYRYVLGSTVGSNEFQFKFIGQALESRDKVKKRIVFYLTRRYKFYCY